MRRKNILQIIEKEPGIGFNEIARQTKLSNGVISHYILHLLNDKEIVKSEGARAKYFHHKISKKDRKLIIIFRNNTNYEIIKFLLKIGFPVTAEGIRKRVKKSRSTISVNLKKLEKSQVIGRKILNKNTKLTSDIGFYLLDEEYVKMIFSKYELN